MIEQTTILSARRAYAFGPDDLRLTVLSVSEVSQQIQQFFSFQATQLGTPLPTFGPIPNTVPPGLVFDYGTTQTSDNVPTPMRFMHVEPRRIVIDVAGPSSAIDWTFEHLRFILSEARAPDGAPAIGEPTGVQEYSEVSIRYGFGFEEMIGGPLLDLAGETFGGTTMPLGIKFKTVDPDSPVYPAEVGSMSFSRGNMLEIRADTSPEDNTFFSAAELSTDRHLSWLQALDRRVEGSRANTKR